MHDDRRRSWAPSHLALLFVTLLLLFGPERLSQTGRARWRGTLESTEAAT